MSSAACRVLLQRTRLRRFNKSILGPVSWVVDETKMAGSLRKRTLPTTTIFCSSLVIYAARAHTEGLNALPAGVQRRGRGLRPHGGDGNVAFAARHRRHTERPPCAPRSQCPISRSHPSTAHPSDPQTPVPPTGWISFASRLSFTVRATLQTQDVFTNASRKRAEERAGACAPPRSSVKAPAVPTGKSAAEQAPSMSAAKPP